MLVDCDGSDGQSCARTIQRLLSKYADHRDTVHTSTVAPRPFARQSSCERKRLGRQHSIYSPAQISGNSRLAANERQHTGRDGADCALVPGLDLVLVLIGEDAHAGDEGGIDEPQRRGPVLGVAAKRLPPLLGLFLAALGRVRGLLLELLGLGLGVIVGLVGLVAGVLLGLLRVALEAGERMAGNVSTGTSGKEHLYSSRNDALVGRHVGD